MSHQLRRGLFAVVHLADRDHDDVGRRRSATAEAKVAGLRAVTRMRPFRLLKSYSLTRGIDCCCIR